MYYGSFFLMNAGQDGGSTDVLVILHNFNTFADI